MKKNIDPYARLLQRTRNMIKMVNSQLKNFPRHESRGITYEIKGTMYSLLRCIVECNKRPNNRHAFYKMDVYHEQLRILILQAFEEGYYGYKNGTRKVLKKVSKEAANSEDSKNSMNTEEPEGIKIPVRSQNEAFNKYLAASLVIDEVGRLIGGWIRSRRVASN